jgi:hypothetical protein
VLCIQRDTNIQVILPDKNARVFGKMVEYNTLSDLNVLITGGAGFTTFAEKSHGIKRLLP